MKQNPVKSLPRALLALLAWLALGPLLVAQSEAASEVTLVQADLRKLAARATAKADAGQRSREALADEIAEFDTLLAKYAGQPEAQAAVAKDRAAFTLIILREPATAQALYQRVVKDFPGTDAAEKAKEMVHRLSPEGKAEAVAKAKATREAEQAKRDNLIGAPAPEIAFDWSSRAGLGKLSELRGKIVVLDFWATWCAPCIASFPKIREEVAHFAKSPIVFLGVTRVQGRVFSLESKPIDVKDQPEKEYALTEKFMQKHEMTWPVVFCDVQGFSDYGVRTIPYVVIIDPAGKVRHIGLNPLNHEADIAGKVTAILLEFGLPLPPAT